MLTRIKSLSIILSLVYVADVTSASTTTRFAVNENATLTEGELIVNITEGNLNDNTTEPVNKSEDIGAKVRELLRPKIVFKSQPTNITAFLHDSVVLQCEASGIPTPTVHWLKNDRRIIQGNSRCIGEDDEDLEYNTTLPKLELSKTMSKLYLDYITEDDEANYVCVAETRLHKKIQVHEVTVNTSTQRGQHSSSQQHNETIPARIYMSTDFVFEYEHVPTRLYCRAEGNPPPTISWYKENNTAVTNNDKYKISQSGDLIFLNPTWADDMGGYTCVAENSVTFDNASTFFYPTGRV